MGVLGRAAAEEHMAQFQHDMWVIQFLSAVLSIITGGGKWVEMTFPTDPLCQHLPYSREKFWRCVRAVDPPRPDRAKAAELRTA